MRKLWIVVLVTMLVAACGGDDGSEDGGGGETEQGAVTTAAPDTGDDQGETEEEDEASPDTSAPEDDAGDDGSSAAVNVAVITIGDQTFEFDVTPGGIQRCDPGFFGAFWVLGGGLDMLIVSEDHPDHDPPYVKVEDPDTDVEWWAAPDINESLGGDLVPEGASQVDSFTVDGNSVSGTATFIERSAIAFGDPSSVPDPVQGTFEVTCEE